jgi:site-specific DNA-cytosine methylase
MAFNVLSLFDGISCGQLSLGRAGVKYDNYFAAEIKSKAIKITKYNYPDTIQLGDVCSVKAVDLPPIDLLIGGSPCQSFSKTISHNSGLSGKSKLFFEFVRLLKEVKPKYYLLENVAMKKEWEDVITGYMGIEPIPINSELFSAQSRQRLYWTNIPVGSLPTNGSVLRDIMEPSVPEKYYYAEDFIFHGNDKVVCATLNINGHDILKRVNSIERKCQTLTAVCGGNQQKKVIQNGRVRKLTPLEYERLQTIPDGYTASVADSARYNTIGDGWTVDVLVHIFKNIVRHPELRRKDILNKPTQGLLPQEEVEKYYFDVEI